MKHLIVLLALIALPAFATGPTTKPTTVTTNVSGSSQSSDAVGLGLGAASPSANACQATRFFGWTADVQSCQLQQWAVILGKNPTPLQMQLACKDELLKDLDICKPVK